MILVTEWLKNFNMAFHVLLILSMLIYMIFHSKKFFLSQRNFFLGVIVKQEVSHWFKLLQILTDLNLYSRFLNVLWISKSHFIQIHLILQYLLESDQIIFDFIEILC